MTDLPVTILGGYLGAGKTTLVNHLLRHADGRKLAVLVNEFGDLPIDADLIEARDDNLISIAGGCVCCSFGDDLLAALRQMLAMEPRPDAVIVEASGVALPGSIASSMTLVRGLRTEGVVVLADAASVSRRLADTYTGDTVSRQLESADLVLLNRCDLVEADVLARARTATRETTKARVIETVRTAVSPDVVLGPIATGRTSDDAHHHVRAESRSFMASEAVDVGTLAALLTGDERIVRAKGFLPSSDGPVLLQTVGRRADVTRANETGGFVVIAVGDLDWDALAERLATLGLSPQVSSAVR